jgi:hypothetical protein
MMAGQATREFAESYVLELGTMNQIGHRVVRNGTGSTSLEYGSGHSLAPTDLS